MDSFCCMYFGFPPLILSCLFLAALWSTAGKRQTFCSIVCDVFFLFLFFRFVTFSYDVLGQVWSLIVLISDLCVYFTYCPECIIVSEYDQEIPQSQTADNPVASREEPLNHHKTSRRQIKQSNQLSLPHQDYCNTRMDIK